MSLGSILVGLAIVMVTVAYIVRPFRTTGGAVDSRTDKLIEAWVRATPVETPGAEEVATAPETLAPAAAPAATTPVPVVPPSSTPATAHGAPSSGAVNFCPQCGRRVTAEYRFCPGCGTPLPHEEHASSDGAPLDGDPLGGGAA
ncbi:MAG: zinc ribbon domain-containing protein [Anaerolineae bacterium]